MLLLHLLGTADLQLFLRTCYNDGIIQRDIKNVLLELIVVPLIPELVSLGQPGLHQEF